jgi:nucleotide-binding universal stress UspA family protein
MFNRILVPTNFSTCAHNAVKFACDMLRGQKATVVLMHACDPSLCKSADEHDRKADHVNESLLNEKSALQSYAPTIDFETELYEGRFTTMSARYFKEKSIDLLVIGSDGINPKDRSPKDTNTELFLASHRQNMIVVPNGVEYMGFGNILFATDYRYHLIDNQLEIIRNIMTIHDSKNYVLHVRKDLSHELDVAKIIEKQTLEHEFAGQDPEFHEVSAQKIEEGIFKFVNSYKIDLVALIPRKNTLSERIFRNSITKKVAELTNKPLLVLN